MKVNKRGERHITLKNPDAIGLVETLAEVKHIRLFEAAEMLILNAEKNDVAVAEEIKHDYVYIRYPLESLYLNETIDALLTTYNTVSIQKTSECYILIIESEVK